MSRLNISDSLLTSEIAKPHYLSMPNYSSIDTMTLSKELQKVYSTLNIRTATFKIRSSQISYHNGLKCIWINNAPLTFNLKQQKSSYLYTKRLFDIIISGLALIVLSPILLTIALIIKLSDSGSVFFKQERVGYKNRTFKILKFRTMHRNKCDESGINQTEINDHRVTKIGKFIRRTSIDELPQLINILRGEMSLVGPRPFVKGQLASGKPYKETVPYYDLLHTIIPGLTGWSQANGYRGRTCKRDRAIARIEHDMAYIQNMSFWLDVKIIFLTIWREFFTGSGH